MLSAELLPGDAVTATTTPTRQTASPTTTVINAPCSPTPSVHPVSAWITRVDVELPLSPRRSRDRPTMSVSFFFLNIVLARRVCYLELLNSACSHAVNQLRDADARRVTGSSWCRSVQFSSISSSAVNTALESVNLAGESCDDTA